MLHVAQLCILWYRLIEPQIVEALLLKQALAALTKTFNTLKPLFIMSFGSAKVKTTLPKKSGSYDLA